MATEKKKPGFPMASVRNWWALRRKFRQAIPKELTSTYLASALGMTAQSAQTNVMPTLRACKLVDGEWKPTKRAVEWRDDAKYSEVCEAILDDVYPNELRSLAPDASANREEVERWFANHTGAGASGAGKMAAFYMMLVEKNPTGEAEGQSEGKPSKAGGTPVRRAAVPRQKASGGDEDKAKEKTRPRETPGPTLHINVQVHISAESTAEQIEHIFASMAKHLKDFA